MALEQSVKFGARYTSQALNKKLSGVIPAGVYHGFELKPGVGRTILVSNSEDYPAGSVAVVDRDGYSITVTMKDDMQIEVPAGAGELYVVIQAAYIPETEGYQNIVFRNTSPEDHHVVLGKVSVAADTVQILESMISEDGRDVGDPMLWLLDVSARFISVSTDVIGLQARMTNIENWAKGQGFDPTTTYSGNV